MRVPQRGLVAITLLRALAGCQEPSASTDPPSTLDPAADHAGDLATAHHASAASWDETCDSLAGFQAYGADPMIEACRSVSPLEPGIETRVLGECDLRWSAWQLCLADHDGDQPKCAPERINAMSCQVCHEGDVDSEGAERVIFVDPLRCPADPAQATGDHAMPYCAVGPALEDAAQTQATEVMTKVAVCPALYREQVEQPSHYPYELDGDGVRRPTSAAPRVVVESVVQHAGIITGADDERDGWTSAPKTVHLQNLVGGFASGAWSYQDAEGTKVEPTGEDDGPSGDGVSVVQTDAAATTLTASGTWGTGRWIFSVYVKPAGASQIGLTLRGGERAALAAMTLPESDCDAGPHPGADGFGYEAVGNGWYRVWVASSLLDTGGEIPGLPYEALTSLDISVGPSLTRVGESQGALLWGPQLEQEPTHSFRSEPEVFYPAPEAFEPPPSYAVPTYTKANWTHDWGLVHWQFGCPAAAPIVRRAEQVFVNGEPLRQVLAEEDLRPGTFFVDDGLAALEPWSRWPGGDCESTSVVPRTASQCSPKDPCTLHIAPPVGTSAQVDERAPELGYHFDSVEVSARPHTLVMRDVKNWTIRGLAMRHAGGGKSPLVSDPTPGPGDNEIQVSSASFVPAIGVHLEDNLVVENARYGFGVHGSVVASAGSPGVDLRGSGVHGEGNELARNQSLRNGLMGAGVFFVRDFRITDDKYNENNWRGASGNYRGSFVGAAKMGWLDGAVIEGLETNGNFGHGLWFDHYALDVDIDGYEAVGNEGSGLYIEACPDLTPSGSYGLSGGPAQYTVDLEDALIADNYMGVFGSDSAYVNVHDSRIEGNHDPGNNGAQVSWLYSHFEYPVSGHYLPNGPHHVSLERNDYETCGTDRFYAYSDTRFDDAAAPGAAMGFLSTLVSDCNRFSADEASATLVSLESDACRGAPLSGNGGCAHGFFNAVISALDPATQLSIAQYDLGYWQAYVADVAGVSVDGASVEGTDPLPAICQ